MRIYSAANINADTYGNIVHCEILHTALSTANFIITYYFCIPNIELPYNKLSLQQSNYSAGAYNGM